MKIALGNKCLLVSEMREALYSLCNCKDSLSSLTLCVSLNYS